MRKIQDQIGNKLVLYKTPTKIISLVPSLTELLVDLVLDENIVGITKFCVHPLDIRKSKLIVGGTKNINFKKITELQPDIIICNKEENTKEIVEKCKKIAPTHTSDIKNIKDTLELISMYGEIFSVEEKSKSIQKQLSILLTDFKVFLENKKTRKVVYIIWKKPWMVAANDTFINYMLALNKFDNIYKDLNRYPEINLEDLQKKKDLELVFLSSEPYPFKEKDLNKLQHKFANCNLQLVNGEYFSWYGTRLLKAFTYFKSLH